jgi:hypothetical protein
MYAVSSKNLKTQKMNKNSTVPGKCITLITIAIFSFISFTQAQTTSPKLKFASPVLVSGTAGQKHATYKFSNVIEGVDAFVKIESIKNGAVLVNIDDSTLGYYDAWQPTIGGPGTYGTSSIRWSVEFKTASGSDYQFPIMDLTAVDIDGDNSRVREFIDMNGQSSFDVPTVIPSLLTISYTTDDDNGDDDHGDGNDDDGNQPNTQNLHVLGPIANRTGIDTTSLDVKMNFHFINQSVINVTIGSQVDGTTGGTSTDRYNSLYFKSTSNIIKVLPVTYRTFDALLSNNAVNLSWITDAQTGNDHFEVERSFDQTNFSTIGIVLGAQHTNGSSNQYSFKDAAQELQNHIVIYYRLKQVDADGKFTYSVVKLVRMNTVVTKAFVQVSPNPYLDKLNVNFVSDASGKAEVRLTSATGNLIKINSSPITKGYNNIQLQDLQSQAPGLYVATIIINGKAVASLKVLKQ